MILTKPIVVLDARVLSGAGGGPDKTIIHSPRFLEPVGYRMICAYMHAPDDPGFTILKNKAANKGVTLLSVADHGATDWRVVSRMLEVCRRERVQVWHGHDYKTNLLGLLLNKLYPMRMITTVHGWVQHTQRTPLYYWLDRLSLRYYEKVLCVSEDLVSLCHKSGVPKNRLVLLENGIDLEEFQRTQSVEQAKKSMGFDPHRFLIGAAGRLSPEKGFDLLIQCVDPLVSQGLNVELAIAGEGSEKDKLQQLIQKQTHSDRIRLLGYQSDLRTFYESMDVYVLSSYREGLPNVLLEAMAMQVPIVATKVNGVPRLIQHQENGLLIEPGSVSVLTDTLKQLLPDEQRRRQLIEQGRRTVETRYSFAERMRKLIHLYDRMFLGRERIS